MSQKTFAWTEHLNLFTKSSETGQSLTTAPPALLSGFLVDVYPSYLEIVVTARGGENGQGGVWLQDVDGTIDVGTLPLHNALRVSVPDVEESIVTPAHHKL